MSATALLAKVNRFLLEQTRVEEDLTQRSLQLVWQSSPGDPITDIVSIIQRLLPPPDESFERAEPSPETLVLARLTRKPWSGPAGAELRRFVWKLSDEQLALAADWLDQYESAFAEHSAGVFLNKHAAFHWNSRNRGTYAGFPEPTLFGAVLSRPRHIQIPFLFYDAEHYRRIKRYIEEIGLASLLDRCIRPKGSLNGGGTVGAG